MNPMRPRRDRIKATAQPHSPCPNCYRDAEPLQAVAETAQYTFVCSGCGATWSATPVVAKRHGDWLTRAANHMRNVGDV